MPKIIDVKELEGKLEQFADDRNWAQFHSPKNLAMALTAEVGELVEIFQWLTEEQSRSIAADPKSLRALADELADVLIYTVRLAAVAGVDLNEAVLSKLQRNESKYPIEKSYGKSDKYDKL